MIPGWENVSHLSQLSEGVLLIEQLGTTLIKELERGKLTLLTKFKLFRICGGDSEQPVDEFNSTVLSTVLNLFTI